MEYQKAARIKELYHHNSTIKATLSLASYA